MAVERVLDEPVEVRVVAHVADLDARTGLRGQALERVAVAPRGDDLGAGSAQDAHEALAEAARGAGDDRDASIEAEQPVELRRRHRRRVYRGRRGAPGRSPAVRRARGLAGMGADFFAENSALARDAADPSRRADFLIPPWPGADGGEWAYFAGNSLGPAAARGGGRRRRRSWTSGPTLAVEGWFEGDRPVADRRPTGCAGRSPASWARTPRRWSR